MFYSQTKIQEGGQPNVLGVAVAKYIERCGAILDVEYVVVIVGNNIPSFEGWEKVSSYLLNVRERVSTTNLLYTIIYIIESTFFSILFYISWI